MPKVVALYRYPRKRFYAGTGGAITVLPGGRVAGDRVLNFRFADAPAADTAWCRKYHGVVLANTPGLARLKVRFDERANGWPSIPAREFLRMMHWTSPGASVWWMRSPDTCCRWMKIH